MMHEFSQTENTHYSLIKQVRLEILEMKTLVK